MFYYDDPHNTLVDLCGRATKKRALGTVAVEGMELRAIEVERHDPPIVCKYFLDPARNYAVVRREVSTVAGNEFVGFRRVLESREVKPGIHFPMHVEGRGATGSTVLDIQVLKIQVNEPIQEEAFAFDFPTGAAVKNDKTGEVHVWGEGTPARTFPN